MILFPYIALKLMNFFLLFLKRSHGPSESTILKEWFYHFWVAQKQLDYKVEILVFLIF
jgi:hypothetical protein